MRLYVGDRSAGDPRVWVVHHQPDPPLEEVVSFLDELRALAVDHHGNDPVRPGRRSLVLARKHNLLARIQAAENTPEPTELPRPDPAGGSWEWSAPYGRAGVARAILAHELGHDPPIPVCIKFADDVLANLPRSSFRLPASEVWTWVEANRRLVETELFERPPALDPVPVAAIEPAVVYVGDATDGILRVWIVPEELCRDLPEVVDVLEAAESLPAPEPLTHPVGDTSGLVGWSLFGPPGTDLAAAILARATGTPPPLAVAQRFREDVVSQLPPVEFALTPSQVSEWIAAHPELLEAQRPNLRPADHDPSLAVVHHGHADGATASSLVGAIEAAWSAIQAAHPQVPDAVIVLGTGVERGRLVKLGHWWDGRWLADGKVRGEVLLAGEALHLKPEEVFEVLLHEAAHGLNAARGVKDSSRGGRYHNQQYKAAAEQLGLRVQQMPPYGWARTLLTPATAEAYAGQIRALGDSMRIARQIAKSVVLGAEPGAGGEPGTGAEPPGDTGAERQPRSRNGVKATCGCGRRLRMAPTVLAQGPVVCGVCGVEFTTGAHKATGAEPEIGTDVVADTFLERRQRALALEAVGDPGSIHGGTLAAWREAWGTERELLLVGSSPAEVERLNHLAHGLLKHTGALHGPAVTVAGRELMAGDCVVVGPGGVPWPGHPDQPAEEGEVGIVQAVDPNGAWVEIDFAIEGHARFPTPALGGLAYGYAIDEHDVVPELDVFPDGQPSVIGIGAEPGFGPEVELP